MSVNSMYNVAIVWWSDTDESYLVKPDTWATDGTETMLFSVKFDKKLYPNKKITIPYHLVGKKCSRDSNVINYITTYIKYLLQV